MIITNYKKFHRKFNQKSKKLITKHIKKIQIYKLVSTNFALIEKEQLEAARRSITKLTKRKGKVYIKLNLNIPITLKSKGSRMGKGKGKIKFWLSFVYPGKVLFEVTGVPKNIAKRSLILAKKKLSI